MPLEKIKAWSEEKALALCVSSEKVLQKVVDKLDGLAKEIEADLQQEAAGDTAAAATGADAPAASAQSDASASTGETSGAADTAEGQ